MKTFNKDNKMRSDKRSSGRSFDGGKRTEKPSGRSFADSRKEERTVDRSFNGGKLEGKPTRYKSRCSECGDDCEVPFKPNGKKPILCSMCFAKSDGSKSERPSGRANDGQLDIVNEKLDKILKILNKISR